jgi:hypothetical protein
MTDTAPAPGSAPAAAPTAPAGPGYGSPGPRDYSREQGRPAASDGATPLSVAPTRLGPEQAANARNAWALLNDGDTGAYDSALAATGRPPPPVEIALAPGSTPEFAEKAAFYRRAMMNGASDPARVIELARQDGVELVADTRSDDQRAADSANWAPQDPREYLDGPTFLHGQMQAASGLDDASFDATNEAMSLTAQGMGLSLDEGRAFIRAAVPELRQASARTPEQSEHWARVEMTRLAQIYGSPEEAETALQPVLTRLAALPDGLGSKWRGRLSAGQLVSLLHAHQRQQARKGAGR